MTSEPSRSKTAVIVGASRGLGLALTEELWLRGWQIIATQRDRAPALEALAARSGDAIALQSIDIADPDDVVRLRDALATRTIDLLMVNAGISIAQVDTPLSAADDDFTAMMMINALSPVRVAESLCPFVRPGGVIAFMSSELASLANNPGTHDLYSASKAALNMLVKCFASRGLAVSRSVVLMAPGWVRTEIGGDQALLSIDESIPMVAAALEANLDKPGLRFIDRFDQPIAW